ncbi:MAG: helix-turn-helix domain-containing protein [Thermodesulfobacteriota bacterium]
MRACNLLRFLAREKTVFKLSELARQLQLDRGTTYRERLLESDRFY